MKTYRLKEVHLVFFETTKESFRINELIGEDGKSHFSVGHTGNVQDMVPLRRMYPIHRMLRGENLLEAKAGLMDMYAENMDHLSHPGTREHDLGKAWDMLSELKDEDLPLLIGKFHGLQPLIECRLKGETPKELCEPEPRKKPGIFARILSHLPDPFGKFD